LIDLFVIKANQMFLTVKENITSRAFAFAYERESREPAYALTRTYRP